MQPYVKAKREATEEEIADYIEASGFEMDYENEFHNMVYEVVDTRIRLKQSLNEYF